jgi:iron(III) transport system permease protein
MDDHMSGATLSSPLTAVPAVPARRGEWLREDATQGLVWLVTAALVVVPLLPLLYASVRSRPLYESGGSFTLQGYRQLLSDQAFWKAALNTAEFAATATAIAVAVGAGIAVLCERTDLPGRRLLGNIALLPLLLPPLGGSWAGQRCMAMVATSRASSRTPCACHGI